MKPTGLDEETASLLERFNQSVEREQSKLLQLGIPLSFYTDRLVTIEPAAYRERALDWLKSELPQTYEILSWKHGVELPLAFQMLLLSATDELDRDGQTYLRHLDAALGDAVFAPELPTLSKKLRDTRSSHELVSLLGELAVARALVAVLPGSLIYEPSTSGNKRADWRLDCPDGRRLFAEVKVFNDDFWQTPPAPEPGSSRLEDQIWPAVTRQGGRRARELEAKLDGRTSLHRPPDGVPERLLDDEVNLLFVCDAQRVDEAPVGLSHLQGRPSNLQRALEGLFESHRWTRVSCAYRWCFNGSAHDSLLMEPIPNPRAQRTLAAFPELQALHYPVFGRAE